MFSTILKSIKNNFTFILLLTLFWLSINTGSKYLNFSNEIELEFKYFFNLIRAMLPYLIFVFFILKFNKYLKNKIFNKNYIFLCFFLFGIFQIIGLIISSINYYEHYWIACLLSLLIYFQNILVNKNSNLINSIYLTNVLFIFILLFIFSSIALKENIFSYNLLYHSKSFNYQLAGEYFPRSSGISRMALIIFFFLNSIFFSKLFEKKINYSILLLNCFLIFIILILQSRTVILFFIISFFFINIFFRFEGYRERFNFFLMTLILPFLMFISYPIIKSYLIEKFEFKTETFQEDKDKINFLRNDFAIGENQFDITKNKFFSNNRVDAWRYLLQVFFKGKLDQEMENKIYVSFKPMKKIEKKNLRIFFGFGPQADRRLMKLEKIEPAPLAKSVIGPFGAHASNIFIYSLICGGILGLFIILILNLLILYKILKILKYREQLNLKQNYILTSSIRIILFLMFRSLLENSYGVFGVDLIVFLSAYAVIENNLKKIND